MSDEAAWRKLYEKCSKSRDEALEMIKTLQADVKTLIDANMQNAATIDVYRGMLKDLGLIQDEAAVEPRTQKLAEEEVKRLVQQYGVV